VRQEEGWPELWGSEATESIKEMIRTTIENRRRSVARKKVVNGPPKKRGRPSNPGSTKKKLKALHEEYRTYLERMRADDKNDEDDDDEEIQERQ